MLYLRSVCGFGYGVLISVFAPLTAHAEPASVCARVVIQIDQELTLEREGFEARLGITNGLPSALEDFRVTLKFADADGNPIVAVTEGQTHANSRFFYRLQTGYTQPTRVAAGTSPQVAYLIVPAIGASGTSAAGSVYQVGATIKYRVTGQEETVEIAPDTITVRPMPQLQLQYFLPGDVYGDDPLTTAVEPLVPFALGVRVSNHSPYATARKLNIQSSQPEIIENEHGLLTDFRIVGAQVNGTPAQPTLLANFGDIAPRRASVGNWLMTATLSGKFIKFSAEVSHAPEFGGALTSLIPEDAVSTHRLLGQVLTDLPDRDGILDFLAVNSMTGEPSHVNLYESDNDEVSSPVAYHPAESGAASLAAASDTSGSGSYTLTLTPAAALIYTRLPSPFPADKTVRALRSDGKVLPAANAWVSKAKNSDGVWIYTLNLFDTGKLAAHHYALTFTDPLQANRAPVLTLVGGRTWVTAQGRPFALRVTATDPDSLIPSLSTAALPDGATFADAKNGTGLLTWRPTADQVGAYVVQFRASDGALTDTQSAQIEVTAQPTVGLSAWQNCYWPGVTDPAVIGRSADPDGDRLDNLLEYALDADPTHADDTILPEIGTVEHEGQSYLALTYRRRTDDPALRYEVVSSDTLFAPLATWTVQTDLVAPDANASALPEGLQRIKIRDSVPISTGPLNRYLRLRVTHTEEAQ